MKKKPNAKRQPAVSACRDCGATERVPRYLFTKANRPRCTKCGGCLEYQGGWSGVKDRGKA